MGSRSSVLASKPSNGQQIDSNSQPSESSPSVELKPIRISSFKFTVVGTSPLIVHKFSEKAIKQIADKQQKKAARAREAKDPHAEYLAAMYVMPGSKAGEKNARYGFPAPGFKNAAVDACSFIEGVTKVEARGSFHIMADAGGLVEIKFGNVSMREDTVRLGMNGLDLRYRPEFTDWRCTLNVRYNSSCITPEQIVNLFNVAGFSIGVGEWRPQRDGSNGMFEVKAT